MLRCWYQIGLTVAEFICVWAGCTMVLTHWRMWWMVQLHRHGRRFWITATNAPADKKEMELNSKWTWPAFVTAIKTRLGMEKLKAIYSTLSHTRIVAVGDVMEDDDLVVKPWTDKGDEAQADEGVVVFQMGYKRKLAAQVRVRHKSALELLFNPGGRGVVCVDVAHTAVDA